MSTTALEAQVARVDDELDPVQVDRSARFQALGFSEVQADLLAVTRDGAGFWLYHGDVKRMLDGGCSHDLAMKILVG